MSRCQARAHKRRIHTQAILRCLWPRLQGASRSKMQHPCSALAQLKQPSERGCCQGAAEESRRPPRSILCRCVPEHWRTSRCRVRSVCSQQSTLRAPVLRVGAARDVHVQLANLQVPICPHAGAPRPPRALRLRYAREPTQAQRCLARTTVASPSPASAYSSGLQHRLNLKPLYGSVLESVHCGQGHGDRW